MAAFTAAKQRFIVHLRPDDVAEQVAEAGLDEIADALAQLMVWGNLRAGPDTGWVSTMDDFDRPRYLYQLTPAGEAAEIALAAFDAALGRRGELQAVALEDIRLRLLNLYDVAAGRGAGRGGGAQPAAWGTTRRPDESTRPASAVTNNVHGVG
jgi:uncharacterized protein (TIGR02677 family)